MSLARLATPRWRVPKSASSAHTFSTSPWSFHRDANTIRMKQHVDTVRRLRRHERLASTTLLADVDDFLNCFGRFYKSKSAVDNHVKAALRQNKYLSTERLKQAETVASVGHHIVEQYKDFKAHLKDLEEEPYPEWRPGDSDVITRQLSESNRKLEDYEDEKNLAEQNAGRDLDKAEKQYEALLRTRDALRERGLPAAEAVANDFINSHLADYSYISAPLDPIDLDTISEDIPDVRASLVRTTAK